MTILTSPLRAPAKDAYWALHTRQPHLARAALLCLITVLPCLGAMACDPRTVNDISVWIKPVKFLFSLALYYATLAWYFGYLPVAAQRSVAGRFVIAMPLVVGLLEMAWLLMAAVQGVPAHYNRSSLGWMLAYSLAGVGATLLLVAMMVQGVMVARSREACLHPAMRRALALGAWLAGLATLGVTAVLAAGSGHWVGGVPSDAQGLPLLGWARQGGDLRVAHFFALHLHQALPLAGWLIVRSRVAQPLAAVHLAAAAGLGWTLFTLAQALRGQPFIG